MARRKTSPLSSASSSSLGAYQDPAEGTGKDQRGGAGTVNAKIKNMWFQTSVSLYFLVFLQIGEAYRFAAGADFGAKLIGMMKTIGPAFGTIADMASICWWALSGPWCSGWWSITSCGTQKKFRKDVEWFGPLGDGKRYSPFVDPKFENNVILTGTEFLTMNTRPKIPANARNSTAVLSARRARARPGSG